MQSQSKVEYVAIATFYPSALGRIKRVRQPSISVSATPCAHAGTYTGTLLLTSRGGGAVYGRMTGYGQGGTAFEKMVSAGLAVNMALRLHAAVRTWSSGPAEAPLIVVALSPPLHRQDTTRITWRCRERLISSAAATNVLFPRPTLPAIMLEVE